MCAPEDGLVDAARRIRRGRDRNADRLAGVDGEPRGCPLGETSVLQSRSPLDVERSGSRRVTGEGERQRNLIARADPGDHGIASTRDRVTSFRRAAARQLHLIDNAQPEGPVVVVVGGRTGDLVRIVASEGIACADEGEAMKRLVAGTGADGLIAARSAGDVIGSEVNADTRSIVVQTAEARVVVEGASRIA